MWRIDLSDYGWTPALWERLLETNEPYYHQRQLVETVEYVTEFEERGNYYDGFGQGRIITITHEEAKKRIDLAWRTTERIPKRIEKKKFTEQSVLDPSNGLDALLLARMTGSQIPMMRADKWLYETAIAKDRKVGYYDWLKLGKKESEFQRLGAVDVALAKKARRELAAVVGESSVTLNNRELQRFQTITGGYWRSLDYDANTEFSNPLRLLDGDAKHKASEQYIVLPNGLFAFGLFNEKGDRQDTAPDNIASDSKSRSTDKRVHVGRSCIVCHEPGIQEIDDWMRKIYKAPFTLDSPDLDKQKRLRQIYLSDLDRWVKRDQGDYAETLKGLNGLTSAQNAKAFADAWSDYADHKRTLADGANEIGIEEVVLREKLSRYAKAKGNLDPILAAMIQGRAVKVEHWEEVFPQVILITRQP